MKSNWIVMANASLAHIYSVDEKRHVQLLHLLEHADSRKKNADLVSDKQGHYQSKSLAHGSYSPHHTPKDVESEHFAIEIAQLLEHAKNENSYHHLIIIAPPHFEGQLKHHLHKAVLQQVQLFVSKDYAHLDKQQFAALAAEYAEKFQNLA